MKKLQLNKRTRVLEQSTESYCGTCTATCNSQCNTAQNHSTNARYASNQMVRVQNNWR